MEKKAIFREDEALILPWIGRRYFEVFRVTYAAVAPENDPFNYPV